MNKQGKSGNAKQVKEIKKQIKDIEKQLPHLAGKEFVDANQKLNGLINFICGK